MKFDSSRAWTQASQAVSANREVVLALAGVFFLLPQLVFSIFFPPPETGAGMSEAQMMTALKGYYVSIAPVLIPMALFQALGSLSLLCLLDSDRRPTVGGAIRAGLKGVVPYILAQMLTGMALAVIAMAVAGVLGMVGGVVGGVIGLALVLVLAIFVGVRLSIAAPVIAVEHVFNPVAALVRSWKLTRGNTARLLGFYALLVIAMVVLLIFGNVLTMPIALLAPGEVARFVAAAVEAVLATVMALYFVAVIAQVHRQLAGPSAETQADLFG
ncbi:hypothetical protein [Novosphingobium guangzhouense]|uniref:DUF7847 domain-containing protein n=1 Tax=Novosphingobium guangzhouense TaxID=1850347 RepID=A0A2K2G4D7_9SPHN|nr:hypothetical protein [Novosphingobium guangzhouense]PNU05896.1 hypothetical protein A8V01_13880 [Novosphingobium guangzhouense]